MNIKNNLSVLFAALLWVVIGCKENIMPVVTVIEIPTVTISGVSNITLTTAVSGGVITSDGGSPVTSRGVCWDTNHNPTILNSKTTDGTGQEVIQAQTKELQPIPFIIYGRMPPIVQVPLMETNFHSKQWKQQNPLSQFHR